MDAAQVNELTARHAALLAKQGKAIQTAQSIQAELDKLPPRRRRRRPATGLPPDAAPPAADPAPSASATPEPPPQPSDDAIHRSVTVALAKLEGERRTERRAIITVVCAVIGAAGTLLAGIAALVAAVN